jgi:hypothetical protein
LIRKLQLMKLAAKLLMPSLMGANGSVGSRKKTLTYDVVPMTASVSETWLAGSSSIVQSTFAPVVHVVPPQSGSKTDVLGSQASPKAALDTCVPDCMEMGKRKASVSPGEPC